MFGATYTRLREGLRLHDVTSGDSGMYECMVDNRLGTDSRTAMVRVEGKDVAMYDVLYVCKSCPSS